AVHPDDLVVGRRPALDARPVRRRRRAGRRRRARGHRRRAGRPPHVRETASGYLRWTAHRLGALDVARWRDVAVGDAAELLRVEPCRDARGWLGRLYRDGPSERRPDTADLDLCLLSDVACGGYHPRD